MPAQPEAENRYYALERLREARSAIGKGAHLMLVSRARIEKYRQSELARAQEAYLELQRTRDRIVTALGEARLALLEAEERGLSRTAGKLQKGLSGFDLMSMTYKPVYEALTGFAERLPAGDQTTDATIIGRLMNNVKLGYYPTDPENISHILRGIQFPADVTSNLLDPCCGCGKALRQLAQGNNCYAYGVELDECRAEEAQTRLHRVGMGSFFYSRISNDAFHILFLNPPYLSVLNESGNRARHEKRFLVESLSHLMVGGLLIYLVPYYRLTPDICRILCDNFTNLSIWRFTDVEFKKFNQAAVLGIRKRRADDPEGAAALEKLAYEPTALPCITDLQENRYPIPANSRTVEVFKGEKFNERELEQQLLRSDSFKKLMSRSELDKADKRPLLPLSIGQVGLIGGSGMINGLIDCETPHIIKGRIIKVKQVEAEDKYSSKGIHMGQEIREVISNKMIFNVLTPDGFKALT